MALHLDQTEKQQYAEENLRRTTPHITNFKHASHLSVFYFNGEVRRLF